MKDFKKQKIKLGKSLKPASNSTDTAFKTKKINVPIQTLKKNIKDLFNKTLNRRELIQVLDSKENQNLIWNSLLNLILGDDHRRKLLKSSWNEILEKLDHVPFLGLISTHLNCALCHVDRNIRLDALEILDNTSLEGASRGILEKILYNLLQILDQKSSYARLLLLTVIFKLLGLLFKSDLLPWQKSCLVQKTTFNNDFINLEVISNDQKIKVTEIQEKLLPTLLNCWIESAVILEKEIIQDSNELKILHVILMIMGILGNHGSKEELLKLKSCFEKFKGFPFATDKESDSSGEVLEADKIDGMLLVIWEIVKYNLEERVDILVKLLKFKVVDRSNIIYEKKFEFLSFVMKEIDENRLDQELKQNERLCQEFKNWIFTLPRKIWELKINNMTLSRKLLEFLVHILQRNTVNICWDEGLEKFQLSLIPLFHVVSPKGDLFGPFKSYTLDCQQLMLNLLFYLPEINHKLLVSIVSCLTNVSISVKTVANFMDIIYERQSRCKVPLEKHVYASVCTTLLVGYSSREINCLQNQVSPTAQGFYGMDDCYAFKQNLSGSAKKSMISKEEHINDRIYLVKRIFYAFGPFLEELPKIVDNLSVSILPLDSIFCFCLALSNINSINPANNARMMQAVKNDEFLKNMLITHCPGKYDHYLL